MGKTIGVLANGKVALPAIQYLRQSGFTIHLVLPQINNPEHAELEYFGAQWGCEVQKWDKESLEENFESWHSQHQIEVVFVMTFPFLFSKKLLEGCKVPLLNVHYAPLPRYRGAQPVFWLIRNGDKKGAVNIHRFGESIDAGDILHHEDFELSPNEIFGSYMAKASQVAVRAIHNTLLKLEQANWQSQLQEQEDELSKLWPKPNLNDVRVKWDTYSAEEIVYLSNACNPWNKGVITYLNGKEIKLLAVEKVSEEARKGSQPGELITLNGNLVISCKNNQAVIPNIIYTAEGFYAWKEVHSMGLQSGMKFD